MKDIDKKILQILQENGEKSMEDLGSKVNLSPSPCYRRVKNLKDAGFIERNVAVLNKHKLNLERPYFVHVKTTNHNKEWTDQFKNEVAQLHIFTSLESAEKLAGPPPTRSIRKQGCKVVEFNGVPCILHYS